MSKYFFGAVSLALAALFLVTSQHQLRNRYIRLHPCGIYGFGAARLSNPKREISVGRTYHKRLAVTGPNAL